MSRPPATEPKLFDNPTTTVRSPNDVAAGASAPTVVSTVKLADSPPPNCSVPLKPKRLVSLDSDVTAAADPTVTDSSYIRNLP